MSEENQGRREVKQVTPIDNDKHEMSTNVENLNVDYQYQAPKIENFDSVYQNLKAVSERYSKVIIPDAEQAHEIGKRGGLLTQMRKVERQANDLRAEVHRAARASHTDFDDKMGKLTDLIRSNIDHLNTQVNSFKQQADEQRFEEIKKIYTDEKQSYQFKDVSSAFASFNDFYDKRMLHNHTDNKIKEAVVGYLSGKARDDQIALKFFRTYPDVAKIPSLVRYFKDQYSSTGDIKGTIINVMEQKAQLDKLIKEKADAEVERQRRADQQAAEKSALEKRQAELSAQMSSDESNLDTQTAEQKQSMRDQVAAVSFEITDLSKVGIVKEFLEKNGISFTPKFITKD